MTEGANIERTELFNYEFIISILYTFTLVAVNKKEIAKCDLCTEMAASSTLMVSVSAFKIFCC